MSWDEGLTGSALDIANTDEKRLRVRAGPGTGKSFALKRRVMRMLEQGQDPTRILAVTFTRNAAADLVKDLNDLNVTGCENVRASTLHSYCFSLLNSKDVFERLDRTPRLVVTPSTSGSLLFEGSMLINDLVHMQEFGKKRDCTKRMRAFEAAWARLQSERPGWPMDPIDNLFEKSLLSWLCFHQAMLVGELVPEALRFLRSNPASDVITVFDHILVDEYQDLNRADQEIINILSDKCSLVIVGDVDQSIYSFRHANPDGIDDFENRHRDTRDESLTECRRCPIRVVEIANQLISHNHQPNSPPRLQVASGKESGEVHIIQWKNQSEEAKGVAKYVDHLLNEQSYKAGDILIVTPRRKLAYKIRDIVRKRGISIHSFYYEEALESITAQRAFALLTLLNDKNDRVALRWWLGHNSPSGLSSSYQKLRKYCEDNGRSPRDVLEDLVESKLDLPGTRYLLEPFRKLITNIANLSTLNLRDLVNELLPLDDGACSALREIAENALTGSQDIQQLFDRIKSDIVQPEVPKGDFVRIMSPQKAKGLSSKVVIVTGCSEGLLPFVDEELSAEDKTKKMHEQRRLFYVAITRCEEILILSSFISIKAGDAYGMGIPFRRRDKFWANTIASRFIDELGSAASAPRAGSEWQASGYGEMANP